MDSLRVWKVTHEESGEKQGDLDKMIQSDSASTSFRIVVDALVRQECDA